eukprot:SM000003S11049  [mRNA]  locus=s3:550203:562229:- [translate_table: standard]
MELVKSRASLTCMRLLYHAEYVKNVVERRAPHRAAHLALCQEHVVRGDLLLGGPLHDPVDSAVLVFHVGHIIDAEQFAARDPYVLNGLVTKWWIRPWAVVVGCDQSVERLPPVNPVAVTSGIGPVDGDNLGQAAALLGDVGISGMTGFATSEGRVDGLTWCWEMRSVNGRTLDVKCRLPDRFSGLQQALATSAQQRFARGTINTTLTLQQSEEVAEKATKIVINEAAVRQVLEAAEALDVKLPQLQFSPILTLDSILRLPGILERVDCRSSDSQDGEDVQQLEAISASMAAALEQLALSRRGEGTRLASVLRSHLTEIAVLVEQAARLAEAQPKAMKEKLRSQVEELLETGLELDRGRLEQEAAYLATRMDVREEVADTREVSRGAPDQPEQVQACHFRTTNGNEAKQHLAPTFTMTYVNRPEEIVSIHNTVHTTGGLKQILLSLGKILLSSSKLDLALLFRGSQDLNLPFPLPQAFPLQWAVSALATHRSKVRQRLELTAAGRLPPPASRVLRFAAGVCVTEPGGRVQRRG